MALAAPPGIEKNFSDTDEDLRLAADEDGRGPPTRPPAAPDEDLRLADDDGRGPPRARHVEKL